ncbi:MAG: DNA polymerase III subunit delta, partial [Acidobacteria bacterium]|nr:DNA polymerase III subunit delta [Acidobacteriota bacterium]
MARLSSVALLESIASGKPLKVLLMMGSDHYLRESLRASLIEAFVPAGARNWGVVRLSCRDTSMDRILQQAQMLPMLCPRQIIFASDLEAVQRMGEEARENAVEALKTYIGDPAPFTTLVLEAVELDQRMNVFKLLSDKALVVETELPPEGPEREKAAIEIANIIAHEQGVELTPDACRLLADLVNAEPARMASEIAKCASYASPRKSITSEDVEALVISEKKYSVWKLAEILASKKPDQALVFLDSVLREGEEPPAIIGALAWMYRRL